MYSFLQNCTTCIERVKNRVQNGGHNVLESDIIRRYYKSIIKFWDEYRFMVDEWSLFFNGYEYAPILVSFGRMESYQVINYDKQNKFCSIIEIAKDKTHD